MSKSFREIAKRWAEDNRLQGTSAFSRYVMMVFVDCVCGKSSDFTFKGGNLLWLYIKTPRVTVDLDFATLSLKDHASVRDILNSACADAPEGIDFEIEKFKEILQQGQKGAAAVVRYRTSEGATNKFSVDIVYKLPTIVGHIASSVGKKEITVATIENIIADKIATCHRFKSGNTRMKDYDDLWRISKSTKTIDVLLLKKILRSRGISPKLSPTWASLDLEKIWSNHAARYPDLPTKLKDLIGEINKWMSNLLA